MFFAELATPTNQTIGLSVVVIACLAHITNEVLKLTDRFKTKPPVDKQVADLRKWVEDFFATKEEVKHAKELFTTSLVNQDTRITHIREEIDKLSDLVRESERLHEQRAVDLHNRINPLLESIGAMRERAMRHSQVLHLTRDGK